MNFYAFKWNPQNNAVTGYLHEQGFLVGDAEYCPHCGGPVSMLEWLPPFRVEIQLRGKEFGDLTFVQSGDLLVTQKFREVYYKCGLKGLRGFDPVEVFKVTRRSRRVRLRPPMYFRVNAVRSEAALDMAASGVEWIKPPTCTHCRIGEIKRWKGLILEPNTWTGEDAFVPRGLNWVMVTQRFKDACEQFGIKNAEFTPAEEAGHDFWPWEP